MKRKHSSGAVVGSLYTVKEVQIDEPDAFNRPSSFRDLKLNVDASAKLVHSASCRGKPMSMMW